MDIITDNMVIVWAVVVAAMIVIEVIVTNLVTIWFAGGALASLLCAAFGLDIYWQIGVFVIFSLVLLACMRPLFKNFLKNPTVPTNADANIGKEFKLTSDVREGRSEIKINGVDWTVLCGEDAKAGEKVVITEISGNKYIVKKAEK